MITENELKKELDVVHVGTFKDGGTKTFRIKNKSICIRLYSTNKSSLIKNEDRENVEIIIYKNSKRNEYFGKIQTINKLLLKIKELEKIQCGN